MLAPLVVLNRFLESVDLSLLLAVLDIAVIKYWGKRNTSLILPTNSSLSVTLSQDDLRSTTSIRASQAFKQDRLWLNNKEESAVNEGRTGACIREMRKLRKDIEAKDSSLEVRAF